MRGAASVDATARHILAGALAATLVLSGCGGGDGSGIAAPAGTDGAAEDAPVVFGSATPLGRARANPWFRAATAAAAAPVDHGVEAGAARNVILFVGSGMGLTTVAAARILDGQRRGESGEENLLSFETMPFAGLIKTYTVDAQIPDAAGTATALLSGVKTDAGLIGLDEDAVRGDCDSARGNTLVSALELAEIAGMASGIVTTARVTDATPAAAYAKAVDREWEGVSVMPAAALAAGCDDIAAQLVGFEPALERRYPGLDVDGVEVVLGGGRRHFLPADPAANSADAVSAVEGERSDGRNLVDEWRARYPDGRYVIGRGGFDAVDPASVPRLFGLFAGSHMRYEPDRDRDAAGEPSLAEMTAKAIGILERDANGFFLLVEGGRIDQAHRAGNAYNALHATLALADAVRVARESSDARETLIVVTADRADALTLAGYPSRGAPILGLAAQGGAPLRADDDLPYTTLAYANGRGFSDRGADATDADGRFDEPIAAGRADLDDVDATTPGFHQEALVPLASATPGGEDVGVYAEGPGAPLLTGTLEQHVVFHAIDHAAALSRRADARLADRR